MTFTPLRRSFFQPSAEWVAPRLLGHWLIRQTPEGFCGGPIVETEAYLVGDPASHAYAGETPRNRVMFGPPGRTYVYHIYGFHFCVNAVCHRPGRPEAVLIRAIEAEFGEGLMRKNRPFSTAIGLTSGPGKLCAALAIDRKLDGDDLCDPDAPLFIARNPGVARFRRQRGPVVIATRVGITRAAHLPLRFLLEKSPFVSRRVKSNIRPRPA
ncbi:MAG TPA: DNA-3-methyladenine glycosylase [Verrucomicrobiae bacterium]|jgi:DNA-3-methyladenine glycosylase|nr:DNA-3-methyladenine glycosylase [Verrucomicrobiae bacterium]